MDWKRGSETKSIRNYINPKFHRLGWNGGLKTASPKWNWYQQQNEELVNRQIIPLRQRTWNSSQVLQTVDPHEEITSQQPLVGLELWEMRKKSTCSNHGQPFWNIIGFVYFSTHFRKGLSTSCQLLPNLWINKVHNTRWFPLNS